MSQTFIFPEGERNKQELNDSSSVLLSFMQYHSFFRTRMFGHLLIQAICRHDGSFVRLARRLRSSSRITAVAHIDYTMDDVSLC
jgi:hypothetical protein